MMVIEMALANLLRSKINQVMTLQRERYTAKYPNHFIPITFTEEEIDILEQIQTGKLNREDYTELLEKHLSYIAAAEALDALEKAGSIVLDLITRPELKAILTFTDEELLAIEHIHGSEENQ